jgi:peptidyl-prolyl cis-trans isomerase C
MKPLLFLVFLCASPGWAQQPAAPEYSNAPWAKLPDSQELVKIDGRSVTVGEFKAFLAVLPPDGVAMASVNPALIVKQMALQRKLTQMAVEQKLDQQSPLREQLEYNRMALLSQAEIQYVMNNNTVGTDEVQNYYNAHKERFKQVKVRAIKISFSQNPAPAAGGKKALSEAEAKAKAARLLAAIRGGADFVKLVHENSDDEASKARDGDLDTVTPGDDVPAAFRSVVFTLKQGETSEPVRQADGFYLLRAEQVSYRPLSQVESQVSSAIRTDKGMAAMGEVQQKIKVEFTNPAFPDKPAAPGNDK